MSGISNWIPYRLTDTGDGLRCLWLDTYCQPFTTPFFDETIIGLKCKDIHYTKHRSESSIGMINEWAGSISYLEPTAFIFHISRCGSTLAAQMLASANENIVLSEAPFIDDIIRLKHNHPEFDNQAVDTLLKSVIKFYGQQKNDAEKHLFIKMDSWHMFFNARLRALYPNTPFILMYRNPCEVFRSHKKQPGMHAVNGIIESGSLGFKEGETDEMQPDEYLSRVLENYLGKYLDISDDDNVLLINYDQPPKNILRSIIDFSGVTYSEDQLQKMNDRSLYHSKNNTAVFVKEPAADIPASLERAMDLYRRLIEQHSGRVF